MKKLNEILGTEFPIIQGGMAWVAESTLAAAVSTVMFAVQFPQVLHPLALNTATANLTPLNRMQFL